MALIPPRRDQFLTADGFPTTRFAEYLEALGSSSNTVAATVSATAGNTATAIVNDLINRIGSGDALTSDETGFTVDSTLLSVDMAEA